MSTAVIGMPLKAMENAALAATPAVSTFQRWPGKSVDREVVEVMVQRSFRWFEGFENQKLMHHSS
ncbi:hypothetical protein AVHY2522_05885 [Acidovorax sp. SUPP2522]|uniref:hypothetical protein n=1 Tax=Acidovorax sp. SUPP2522 TaxID=511900 RepID=UPI0023DE463D|nr:hypothetical protein [Acidovorax sp. SUPP2522]GKT14795.1 hypothetical protein AVHY2522_05885 [Acidovorax sp. SUPP2522]